MTRQAIAAAEEKPARRNRNGLAGNTASGLAFLDMASQGNATRDFSSQGAASTCS